MNYFTSTKTNPHLANTVLLFVRTFVGFAMLSHGFPKLQQLLSGQDIQFFDLLGLGQRFSLILAVFAEFVCTIFLILGLFTRPAVFFLIVTMAIAALVVHGSDEFAKREMSLLYLSVFLLLFTLGPGKYSVDGMISRRRESKW